MKIRGTREFGARRDVVWEILNDPEQMAKIMPGVERFEVADDAHWTAHVVVPLGLGGLKMKISFEKTEQREPEYAKLNAKGQGVGALMNMETQFHLAEEGGGTAMRWEADVRIAGPVGSMGQRVLQPIVNQQVQSVLSALDKQVSEASGEAGQTPPAGASGEPGEASASEMGAAGTPEPTTDRPPPATDPTLRDEGPPAEGVPGKPEGTSGGEQGVSPLAPEAYEETPEGPTRSTEG